MRLDHHHPLFRELEGVGEEVGEDLGGWGWGRKVWKHPGSFRLTPNWWYPRPQVVLTWRSLVGSEMMTDGTLWSTLHTSSTPLSRTVT